MDVETTSGEDIVMTNTVEHPVDVKQDPDSSGAESEKKSDSELERLKRDMFKYKDRLRETETKLEEATRVAEEQRIEKLKQNEQWEQLAKEEREKRIKLEGELKNTHTAIVVNKKIEAVRTHALKSGIRKEALDDIDMLDLSGVDVETTSTGRVNVLGADDFVARLRQIKPHWFSKSSTSNLNTDTFGVQAGSGVTFKQLDEAEKKAKESGDYAPYEKLLRQWQKQRG